MSKLQPTQEKQKANPLFTQLLSPLPPPQKLSQIRTSLTQGADPNELDNLGRHSIGRPLHYALSVNAGYSSFAQNLPLIQLLLEAGADPRLRGEEGVKGFPEFGRSALDEVECLVTGVREGGGDEGENEEDKKGLKEFYEGALTEMRMVAEMLDAQDVKNAAKDGDGSWVGRLKFW